MNDRGVEKVSTIDKSALERFIYRKDGMDYGPFTQKEIFDAIKAHEIDENTEIRSHRTKTYVKLKDFEPFGSFVRELKVREAEEKKRLEVLKEADRFERRVKRGKWIWVLGVLGVLIVVGGITYFRFGVQMRTGHETSMDIFKSFSLERLSPLKAQKVQQQKAAPVVTSRHVGGKRVVRHNESKGASHDEPKMAYFDFSEDGSHEEGKEPLTEAELRDLERKLARGLLACFQREAESDPSFQGGKIVLYIQPTGIVSVLRFSVTPGASPRLENCAREVCAQNKIRAFSGGAKIAEIPIYILPQR